MAATTLTRTGSFDPLKLSVLEGQLLAAGAPKPLQPYVTATGLTMTWPNGLTAGQITAFQAVINAYVQPTDLQLLTALQQQAITYINLNPSSVTLLQCVQATQKMAKVLVAIVSGKTKIDSTDLSV